MQPLRRMRMKALGWDGRLELDVSAAPPPAPTGQLVLLEVEACGVCHRDLIDRGGGVPFLQLPMTPGHEVAGRVLAVGPGVTRWRVGDRVATMHRDACGACPACVAGETSLCDRAAWVLGIMADGGYATHLTVPESGLYGVPDDLSAGEAATLQCTFGTAYRGLRAGGCGPGATVLVTGAAGGVGSAAVQVARRLGAQVIAVVRDGRHREYLERLGATRVLVDAGDGFHKLPGVGGVDVALDCVGQPTLNSSLRCLRLGGAAVAIGNLVPTERLALNVGLMIVKALRLIGSSGANARDMAELLALRGAEPFHMPIRSFALEDAEAAQRLLRQGGVQGRFVVTP